MYKNLFRFNKYLLCVRSCVYNWLLWHLVYFLTDFNSFKRNNSSPINSKKTTSLSIYKLVVSHGMYISLTLSMVCKDFRNWPTYGMSLPDYRFIKSPHFMMVKMFSLLRTPTKRRSAIRAPVHSKRTRNPVIHSKPGDHRLDKQKSPH